jgi:serine/threonine protein kinase
MLEYADYPDDLSWGQWQATSVRLEPSTRLKILQDIASGLTYLHARQILHRDLSSRNILLSDSSRATITDFGCARRMTSARYTSL